MGWNQFTASDGFAIGMILVIGSSFAVVVSLFLSMRRHAARRDPLVDELIQEVRDHERVIRRQGSAPIETWEKADDWWKES